MTSRLQIRRDTRSTWISVNPVLLAGEIALETDTGQTKIGDGVTAYAQLRYSTRAATDTSTNFASINPVLGTGEIAYESNTGYMKIGNGSTAYNSLNYTRGGIRTETQSNLTNTVLTSGQLVLDTDCNAMKVGNGTSTFNNLSYVGGDYYRQLTYGGAIGPAITTVLANYKVAASSEYEFEFNLIFYKTTAGTVTFTLAATNFTITNLIASYIGSPVGGIGTVGTPQFGGNWATNGSTLALPATGTLTTAVNHNYVIKGVLETPASITNATFGLRITQSAGTVNIGNGSYMKIRSLPNANYGMFA